MKVLWNALAFVRALFSTRQKRLYPISPVTESIIAKLDKTRVAQMADNLLNDPLLMAVLEAIAFQYRQEWELADPKDRDAQHNAHFMLRAVRELDTQLRSHSRAVRTAATRRA